MVQTNPTNVFAAFEMPLEEMEIEIGCIDKAGAKAFESRDDENVHETAERGERP